MAFAQAGEHPWRGLGFMRYQLVMVKGPEVRKVPSVHKLH